MNALLALPAVRNALLALAALALVLAGLAWLRHDAASDARNNVAVESAHTQERIRKNADIAARAAERDGAAGRLRSGTFLLSPVPAGD
ncbi:hypothetical protein [Roseococcus sp.]|uniref:hypothetical protein n=1 Tax=Roseococcus sp. TaxID=2109646 RepID=UPI003BAC58A1